EGGRIHRRRDRFVLRGPDRVPGRLVLRVASDAPVQLAVRAGDREIGRVDLPGGTWAEPVIEIPVADVRPSMAVEVAAQPPRLPARGEAQFTSFHYWLYADD